MMKRSTGKDFLAVTLVLGVAHAAVARSDPDQNCTGVGHWWLDMDNPDNAALLNGPLTVTLTGGDFLGPAAGSLVDISLRVRLEDK